MYRMRVVTPALWMASTVSFNPGPVPGAGANCANNGAAEHNASRLVMNLRMTGQFQASSAVAALPRQRPLSHFSGAEQKCHNTHGDQQQAPFARRSRGPKQGSPAEHHQDGRKRIEPHFERKSAPAASGGAA